MKLSISKRKRQPVKTLPLPTDKVLSDISTILFNQYKNAQQKQKYAPIKEVLACIGSGAVISAAILLPKSVSNIASLLQTSPDWDQWKRYNPSYLKRALSNLEKQKHITVDEQDGMSVITLTSQGKRKILRYSIDTLTIEKPAVWDKKWRVVLYDIPSDSTHTRDIVRNMLQTLGFCPLQDSAYVYPYPCFHHIEFLRQYYFVGLKVQYLLVEKIENDTAYHTFFGLS